MKIFPDKELLNEGEKYLSRYDYNKPLLVSKKDLVSFVSHWAVRQSPKEVPDNLELVLYKFQDHIEPYFDNLEPKDLGFMEMNLTELTKFIKGNLITIKEFRDWNLSEAERKMNVDINDDSRGDYCNQFISIHQDIDPLYDFVDLDALIRNVSHDIYDQNEKVI